ncbi:MAG: Immunoglobulin domain [Fibrobacteria bacterium]|jgi:hypothetical protein|nr:Immunoglobulin domain [Fibrobacteria bacterium]
MENSVIKASKGLLAWMVFSGCLFDGSETFSVSGPQPHSATVELGAGASFKVTASCVGACGEVLYQWRKNGVDLVNGKTVPGSLIAGAQDAELQISNVHYQDAGTYSCFVRHPPSDSLVSNLAILNVIPPP